MLGKQGESEIKLICTEQAFPEFPNLLFGTQIDKGIQYFDASDYLKKVAPEKSVQNFLTEFKNPLLKLCHSYELKFKDICKVNEQGHFLIDRNFTFIFLSYVEQHFLAYMCDRMHDLFYEGVVVSDAYIARKTVDRLSKEVLIQLTQYEETTSTDKEHPTNTHI